MIHLYFGDGKGKTTAAVGLAVRAAGSGMKVLFVQFFKDGSSSEINSLEKVGNIEIKHPRVYHGRYSRMTEAEKNEVRNSYTEFFNDICSLAENYDLIVLDEAVSGYTYKMIDREALLSFLRKEKSSREIVLTGRDPLPELLLLADYATEMHKEKHPFDKGISAREGIEF